MRLRQESSAVLFGVESDGFLRRVEDGGLRLVSRGDDITLTPAFDSHINLEGTVRLGSSSEVCNEENRGSMRFARAAFGQVDQIFVCFKASAESTPLWLPLALGGSGGTTNVTQ